MASKKNVEVTIEEMILAFSLTYQMLLIDLFKGGESVYRLASLGRLETAQTAIVRLLYPLSNRLYRKESQTKRVLILTLFVRLWQ